MVPHGTWLAPKSSLACTLRYWTAGQSGSVRLSFLSLIFEKRSLGTQAQTVRIGFQETQACIVPRPFVFIAASAPAAVSQPRRNRSAGSRASGERVFFFLFFFFSRRSSLQIFSRAAARLAPRSTHCFRGGVSVFARVEKSQRNERSLGQVAAEFTLRRYDPFVCLPACPSVCSYKVKASPTPPSLSLPAPQCCQA